jgi:nucleotide-binding universal stress UspA family protein
MKTIRRILVPIDFSPSSRAAVELATSLAKDLPPGATIDLLHVWHPPTLVPSSLLAVTHDSKGPPLTLEDLARERAEVGLKDARAQLQKLNLETRAHLGVGEPAQEILALADQQHYDLIVMGTRGKSGIAHLLLGSVAERVVRHAHCPVITVKQKD